MLIEDLKQIDENDRFGGIYGLFNKETRKIYVGSSKDVYDRVYGDHFRELNKGIHNNRYLQGAYDIDRDNFIFVLIEKVDKHDLLITREQYWMDSFESHNNIYGYNLTPTAGSLKGFKHSEESRKLIGMVQIGRKASEETKRKMSKSHSGEKSPWFGKKLSKEHIDKIQQSRKGFKQSDDAKRRISESLKGRKKSKESIEKTANSKKIKIVQCDLNGNLIKEWDSAADVNKSLGISSGNIRSVCNGKRKTASGFKWFYFEEYKEDN